MSGSEEITKIGRYRIEGKLGSGGMGDVYLGYDETLERKVALKCINADNRLDDEAKGRFLREAKVLSQLGHPDICQIYDYIEAGDADYLVLELIKGKKLRDSIEEGRLSKKQKLEIIRKIASVLEVAHEKGIIHRDLKPDNIIVTEEEGIKVLDFGLARQIVLDEQPVKDERPGVPVLRRNKSTDVTLALGGSGDSGVKSTTGLTTVGVVMGTLGYMSPEQARGEDVTSFSDMYSFGIIVEEIFSGRTSYNLESSFNVLLEKNQKGEREELRIEEPDISVLVDDLTAFEPNARLTAREAVRRIEEIIGKPAKRRKRVLIASAITLLSVFAVVATFFWIKAARAEKKAVEEAEAAKQVSDFMVGLFEVSDPGESRGNSITAREVLDKGSERIEDELNDQPVIQSRMMMVMGTVYSKLGLYKEAAPLLKKSLDLREKAFGENSLEAAESLSESSTLLGIEGRFKEAEALQRRALEIRMNKLGPDSDEVAASLNNLGECLAKQDKWDEASEYYNRSLRIREKIHGSNHPDVATVLNNMGHLYNRKGSFEEAERNYRRALDIWLSTYGQVHPQVALGLNNLAQTCKKEGKFREAESHYLKSLEVKEKLYGNEHPSVATTLNNLGALCFSEKKYDEAFDYWTRSMAIMSKRFEADNPSLGLAYNNLALVHKARKEYEEAVQDYSKALAIFGKAYGAESIEVAKTLNNLGALQVTLKKYADAEVSYKKASQIAASKLGSSHQTAVQFTLSLAECYFKEKNYSKCEATALEVLRKLEADKNAGREEKQFTANYLVSFYECSGRKDLAEQYSRRYPSK